MSEQPTTKTLPFVNLNTTALQEGMQARIDDDENGTITDNPYHAELSAFRDWYKGYNFEEEK